MRLVSTPNLEVIRIDAGIPELLWRRHIAEFIVMMVQLARAVISTRAMMPARMTELPVATSQSINSEQSNSCSVFEHKTPSKEYRRVAVSIHKYHT
jgi:hypothetical protein